MFFPARRLALLMGALVPFVALPVFTVWSVGPMSRAGAQWFRALASGVASGVELPHAPEPPAEARIESPEVPAARDAALPPELHATGPSGSRGRGERAPRVVAGLTAGKRAAPVRRTGSHVFVGPESIQRAIPVTGRPTSTWTERTADHPAGLLIQSAGALSGVIEPGDILVEAEGQPLGSFDQLLVTVRQAYERHARRLSGRLFRNGDMVPVTVEPGW
jgi:hypothetical protein